MTDGVTWAAVGMAAVSNVALWLRILTENRRRPANGGVQLKDIKEATKSTNDKLDLLEGTTQSIQTVVAEVKTKLDGQMKVCTDTREAFSKSIKETADRLFNHVTRDKGAR